MDAARLTTNERQAVDRFMAAARAVLGAELLEARLFGSKARGDSDAESDIDIALIVTSRGRAMRRAVHDAAFDIGLELRVLLAPSVIEASWLEHLRSRERLFAAELDRDGISL